MYVTVKVASSKVAGEYSALESQGYSLVSTHVIDNKVFAIFHKAPKPKKAKPKSKAK